MKILSTTIGNFYVQTLAKNKQVESHGPLSSADICAEYILKFDPAKQMDFRLFDFEANKVIAYMHCGRKNNQWIFC